MALSFGLNFKFELWGWPLRLAFELEFQARTMGLSFGPEVWASAFGLSLETNL